MEFAVQPFSGKNDGPMPDDLATLTDSRCAALVVVQPITTDNSLGTTELRVKYLLGTADGEPLADESLPAFAFASTATSTDMLTINPKSMEIRRVKASQFEVSFAVPAGTSGFGDSVTIDVRKVTDTSGNAPDNSITCPRTLTIPSSN